MGSNCNCLSKDETHEVTVDKKPGTSQETLPTVVLPAPTATPQLDTEQQTLAEILSLQSTVRAYTTRKQQREKLSQLIELEELAEAEAVEPRRPVSLDQIPPLTPEAVIKRSRLPPFSFDLNIVFGEAKGPVLMTDESVYIGQWKNGRRYGKGLCYLSNGALMEGYWSWGLHQKGRTIFPNGDMYEGQYVHGMKEGKGRFEDAAGELSYEGEWRMDLKHGYGVETMTDGSIYSGHFEQDMKSGSGLFKWPAGEVYTGEFKDNKIHGKGKYVWNEGKWYDGDWFEGSMHGNGRLLTDGKDYEGEFVKDKKHGKGVLRWSGNEYEGDFENNRMHGVGWLTQSGKPKKQFAFENNKRMAEIKSLVN